MFVWVGKEKKRKGWETCRCHRGHPAAVQALALHCVLHVLAVGMLHCVLGI